MRKILLLLIFIVSLQQAYAQLPPGSTAPDWTLVDLNGNTHHLYDYLDAGKTVYIDFYATWCGPCWNYHNTHAMEDLYTEYGPDGTDEVMVFSIEADQSTSEACIYGDFSSCPNTQGDWTAGVNFPQINLTSSNGPNVAGQYQIGYYPTIYGICPNRKITEVGQRQKQGLYNFIATCAAPPLFYSYTKTDIHCTLNDVGGINLTVGGGTTPYTYSWSNGTQTEDISGLAPGTYSVTVTDAENKTLISDVITITGPSSLVQLELQSSQSSLCDQANGSATVEASGGDSGYNYIWSTGASGTTLSNVLGGIYSVTVTDADNCTTQLSVEIEGIPSPTVEISQSGPDLDCDNNTTTLTSLGSSEGTGYTYFWATDGGSILSDPAQADISVGSGGIYNLTIHDVINDCYNIGFFTVSGINGQPDADAGLDKSLACAGGTLTLDGSGSSQGTNFSYLWTTDNGHIVSDPTKITIQVDQIGTYKLKVTNSFNECSALDQTVVSSTGSLLFTEEIVNNKCNLEHSGSIQLSNNNFTFLWSNGETTSGISELAAGSYTVTVSSAGGCEASKTYTITQPTALVLNLTGNSETGPGANDGAVDANVSGGTVSYSYEWSNGATSSSISDLAPGVYTVTVTDANGCSAVKTFTVNTYGCTMTLTDASENVTCFGGNDGAIQLGINSPVGTYTITWDNGETTDHLGSLVAGTYHAVVKDSAGCIVEKTVTITEPSQLVVKKSEVKAPSCPGDSDGSISIEMEGGTGSYSYIWSNGSKENSLTDLVNGDYAVTISDENGCITTTNFTVHTPAAITVSDAIIKTDENGKGSIQLTLDNNWPGVLKYKWLKDGSSFASTKNLAGLDKGVYSLIITTENGCEFGPFEYDLTKLAYHNVNYSKQVNIYPNPAITNITIENMGKWQVADIKVLDQMGNTIQMGQYHHYIENAQVDVSGLAAGIYYVVIDTKANIAVKKLVIIR